MAKKYTVTDADTGEEKEIEGVKSGWEQAGNVVGSTVVGGIAGNYTPLGILPGAAAGLGIGLGLTADDYKVNNLFRQGTAKQLNQLIEFVAKNGYFPSDAEIKKELGSISDDALANLRSDLTTYLAKNNVEYQTNEEHMDSLSPQDQAFDRYFSEIYSTDAGTIGGDIYQNLANIERNNAIANMELAEAQAQQLSMQQAEATKAIADQVRAERMSKLRAGMNEAQIANQDMQTMMSNMQALNQQVAATNAARTQAAQQYNLAQDTAYQQWLQNANTMGQTGAAYSAADAGNAYAQARAYANATGVSMSEAYKIVTGQNK